MNRRKIFSVAIFVLFISLCLNAKEPPADLGYDPPAGWEFVMKLDSLSSFNIHCHNDTCFLTSYLYTIPQRRIHAISSNGGDTWEDIPTLPSPWIFKHNSNTMHRTCYENGETFYERTYDFYKTSERYPALISSLDENELLESPIDTNILISLRYGKQNTHWATLEATWVQISRNAGKNWERLNLYYYPKGYTKYAFIYDWAEKGHWFYRAEDGYDDLNYTRLTKKCFETFDDGRTFREINFDPTNYSIATNIIGLDGKNTMRTFDIKQYRYLDSTSKIFRYAHTYNGILFSNYDTEITNYYRINWLNKIEPNKPMTNFDSAYVFSLNYTNFHFDHSNYSNQVISAYEITDYDIQKRTFKEHNIYLNHTKSFGNDWKILNKFTNKPRIIYTHLDQGTKTLWIHVKDEEFQRGKNNSSYKGSLWKLKLPWESTSVKDISVHKSGFVIYPNPASDYITIQLSKGLKPFVTDDSPSNKELQLFAEGDKVQIFDVLGIEVGQSSLIDNATNNNSQSGMIDLLRIDVSHLSPGVYFIRIGNKVEKFVKM